MGHPLASCHLLDLDQSTAKVTAGHSTRFTDLFYLPPCGMGWSKQFFFLRLSEKVELISILLGPYKQMQV